MTKFKIAKYYKMFFKSTFSLRQQFKGNLKFDHRIKEVNQLTSSLRISNHFMVEKKTNQISESTAFN